VIINEAIEIAKTFGGADGHKFVNGVLDKLAADVRADEVEAQKRQRRNSRAG
jgi:N utilization substance protein B